MTSLADPHTAVLTRLQYFTWCGVAMVGMIVVFGARAVGRLAPGTAARGAGGTARGAPPVPEPRAGRDPAPGRAGGTRGGVRHGCPARRWRAVGGRSRGGAEQPRPHAPQPAGLAVHGQGAGRPAHGADWSAPVAGLQLEAAQGETLLYAAELAKDGKTFQFRPRQPPGRAGWDKTRARFGNSNRRTVLFCAFDSNTRPDFNGCADINNRGLIYTNIVGSCSLGGSERARASLFSRERLTHLCQRRYCRKGLILGALRSTCID